jgi:hypothetical protein
MDSIERATPIRVFYARRAERTPDHQSARAESGNRACNLPTIVAADTAARAGS